MGTSTKIPIAHVRRPLPEPSAPGVYAFSVSPEAPGWVRLDVYLNTVFPGRSRHYWQSKIEAGVVTLRGRTARPASRLHGGHRVEITLDGLGRGVPRDQTPTFTIVHEDDAVLAVNKRAGAFCHPVGRLHRRSVVTELEERQGTTVHPVHRLDRFVSGLMVFALNPGAARSIGQQFEKRTVAKQYLALVHGVLEHDAGRIDMPVGKAHDTPIRMAMGVDPDGKTARTDYQVVERLEDHTLVLLRPRTGRRHQLRLHMARIGHPMVGDPIYGPSPDVDYFERQTFDTHDDARDAQRWLGLHAYRLTFVHPSTGQTVTLEAPLAGPMAEAVSLLRRVPDVAMDGAGIR